jgi:hypothetical protein
MKISIKSVKETLMARARSWTSEPAAPEANRLAEVQGATLLITHTQVSNRHGAGSLLSKIFAEESPLITFYSRDYFPPNELGDLAFHVAHQETTSIGEAKRRIAALLGKSTIRRIFCVPFYPDDVVSALAVHELTGAPIASYVMDDQNVFAEGIPDALMRPLVESSTLRFVISDTLREAYQSKYGIPFWILPPVASARYFVPEAYRYPRNDPPQGVLIGNLWNAEIISQFRQTIRESALQVTWYGNAGRPFYELDPSELAKEGIILNPHLTDEPLVQALRTFDYAIMPSGPLDGSDSSHDWLFRASLPSRLIYLMTTANVPTIVLGHPETAAAKFVTDFGLGACCAYDGPGFRSAVQTVTSPENSSKIRQIARAMAPSFASERVAAWVWASLEKAAPADDRYERLFSNGRAPLEI